MANMDKKKYGFFESVFLSMAGLVIYNCVIQFFVYPSFNSALGSERFGDLLTLLAVMAILSVSAGSGVNLSRLAVSTRFKALNGDFNRFLLLCGAVCAVSASAVVLFFGEWGPLSAVLFPTVCVVVMLRYYSDCEFKLTLNYRRFFVYYFILSVATAAGVLIFKLTAVWELVFILGELPPVLYVVFHGGIYKRPVFTSSENRRPVFRSCIQLVLSQTFSNFILNSDRVLISAILGGSDVTLFYVSSLLGKAMALLTGPFEGVVIGYLAKYNKPITKRFFALCVAASLAVGAAAFVVFIPLAPFIIGLLYPDVIGEARRYFLAANGGQIIFFISNLLLVVILRFVSERYQLLVNGIYITLYFAVCIPVLLQKGLSTFIAAVLFVNLVRLAAVVLIGLTKASPAAELLSKNENLSLDSNR